MNTYLVDADVLINAHLSIYPVGVAPGFWEWLKLQAEIGSLRSIDAVRNELLTRDLREWVDTLPPSFFQPVSGDLDSAKAEVTDWVNNQSHYTPNAKREFGRGADPDLIAFAKRHRHTVITYEVQSPRSKNRIKIPDVCKALEVKHTTLGRVLAREGARFVLDDTVRQSLRARISRIDA